MAQTNSVSDDRADDLDLLYLLAQGVAFFKRFGRLLILFSIIGLLLGALIYWLSPKLYPSNLILQSTMYTTQEQIQIVDNWAEFLDRKEYVPLSQTFNLEPETLRRVKKISAESVENGNSTGDNNRALIIKVLVTDTDILDSLQNSIVYAFGNNGVVRERVAVRKENYLKMIEEVKSEISELDSTKSVVENIINNKITNSSPIIIDVSNINTQLVGLNEKLLNYQEGLKFVSSVQVLQEFIKSNHHKYPNIILTLGIGLVGGLFTGFIAALLINLNRKLKTYNSTLPQAA
jgi:hypothetical protein